MSAFHDQYDIDEVVTSYREELGEEIHAFYLACRNERLADEAYRLYLAVENSECSLVYGEQELAFMRSDYVCDGLDYADLEFREGAD